MAYETSITMAEKSVEQMTTADWHFLSHIVIRRTSFPFEWLNQLALTKTAAVAEQLVRQQRMFDEQIQHLLRQRFPQAVRDAWAASNKARLRAYSRLRRKVGYRTLTAVYLDRFRPVLPVEMLTQLEEVCRHQQTLQHLYTQVEAMLVDELPQSQAVLRQIAMDPYFQEAVFLSNPDMYNNSLTRFIKRPSPPTLSFERKLMAYIQRFCAKNDTASFFGPLNCGRVVPAQAAPIIVEREGVKFSQREIFISFWVVKLLASLISQQQSMKPFLKPRLHPLCDWEGKTLFFPSYGRRVGLNAHQQAIMAQVDGIRTIEAIAMAVEQPVNQVIDTIERLTNAKALLYELALPSTIFHPFDALLQQLEAMPDAWEARDDWLRKLHHLDGLRQAFVGADLPTRQRLLGEMDAYFTKLTGMSPRRGAGKTYADRTLIYEDCAGTFTHFTFDVAFFDSFKRRLQPILDLCAAHATLLQQHYRAVGHQIFTEMSPTGDPVPYATFITAVQQRQRQGLLPPTSPALDRLYTALYNLVEKRQDGHVAQLTTADIEQLMDLAGPIPNCHISPDVMLSAPSFEALCRGEYQVVLGEVHQVIYVWGSQLYFYPQRHLAESEIAHHIEQMPDYDGLATILNERQHKGLLNKSFPGSWIEIMARPTDDAELRVPLKFLQVVDNDGELRLQDGRSGEMLRLYTAGDEQLHLWALAVPRAMPIPVRLGKHTPRIEFDGAVYTRERWQLTRSDWGQDFSRLSLPDLFVRAHQIRAQYDLPRRVFLKVASEPKPYFIDFANRLSLLLIQKLLLVNDEISLIEMMPDYEALWLAEDDGRFCCEFRMTACYY